MTNEQQKPTTPATNPASTPQQNQGTPSPQQNQGAPKPSTDKPASQPQQK
ncbi:MAG TPA: hypothetical protein VII40_01400 [Xanthobacteraceae bacterium]|jgi:hypothetical protein